MLSCIIAHEFGIRCRHVSLNINVSMTRKYFTIIVILNFRLINRIDEKWQMLLFRRHYHDIVVCVCFFLKGHFNYKKIFADTDIYNNTFEMSFLKRDGKKERWWIPYTEKWKFLSTSGKNFQTMPNTSKEKDLARHIRVYAWT